MLKVQPKILVSISRSQLERNIMNKLSNPSNKGGLLSGAPCYGNLGLTKTINLLPTQKDHILSILADPITSKPAEIDGFAKILFENRADILAKPVKGVRKFSISFIKFHINFKLVKVKPIFKKGPKTNVSNHLRIHLLPLLSRVHRKACLGSNCYILKDCVSLSINLASGTGIQHIYFCYFSMVKYWQWVVQQYDFNWPSKDI